MASCTRSLRFIDARAGGRALTGRQCTQSLQLLGETALLAQPAHPAVLEGREGAARSNFAQRLFHDGSQIAHVASDQAAMPSAVLA